MIDVHFNISYCVKLFHIFMRQNQSVLLVRIFPVIFKAFNKYTAQRNNRYWFFVAKLNCYLKDRVANILPAFQHLIS